MSITAIPSWSAEQRDDVISQISTLISSDYGITVSATPDDDDGITFTETSSGREFMSIDPGFLRVLCANGTNRVQWDQRTDAYALFIVKGDAAFAIRWSSTAYSTATGYMVVSKDKKDRICVFWIYTTSTTRRIDMHVPSYRDGNVSGNGVFGSFSDQKSVYGILSTSIAPIPVPDEEQLDLVCENVYGTIFTNTIPDGFYGEVVIGNNKYFVVLSTILFKMN